MNLLIFVILRMFIKSFFQALCFFFKVFAEHWWKILWFFRLNRKKNSSNSQKDKSQSSKYHLWNPYKKRIGQKPYGEYNSQNTNNRQIATNYRTVIYNLKCKSKSLNRTKKQSDSHKKG